MTDPAIQALINYAATAPATDPGEGYWDDMDAAYTCGANAERYEAAKLIRAALASMGIREPPGVPLCPGCSQEADSGEHDPDCEHAEEEQ